MRGFVAAIAMTVGSVAFQLGLQAGWFNSWLWAAPWAWGASVALWVLWLISHPRVEKEWMKEFHLKMGAPPVEAASSQSAPSQSQSNLGQGNNQQQQNSGNNNVQQQNSGNDSHVGNIDQSNSPNSNAVNGNVGSHSHVGNTYNITKGGDNSGWLRPGHEQTPPNGCNIQDRSKVLIVLLGNTVGWTDKDLSSPWTMINVTGHPILSLNTNKKGEIAINAEVYNPQDDAVVVIENNKFTTSNEAFIVDRGPTSLRVTVKHLNEEVLNVRYLNPSTVQITGHFRYQKKDVLVTKDDIVVNGGMHFGGAGCSGHARTLFYLGAH